MVSMWKKARIAANLYKAERVQIDGPTMQVQLPGAACKIELKGNGWVEFNYVTADGETATFQESEAWASRVLGYLTDFYKATGDSGVGESLHGAVVNTAARHFLAAGSLAGAGRWQEAVVEYEEAARYLRALGLPGMEALVRVYQARAHRHSGEVQFGLHRVREAQALLAEAPDDWTKDYVHLQLEAVWGTLCQKLPLPADKAEAVRHFQTTIELADQLLSELEAHPDLATWEGFLLPADEGSLQEELRHARAVGRINLAEMYSRDRRGEDWPMAEADHLADQVTAEGMALGNAGFHLRAAACRMKGQLAQRRAEVFVEGSARWTEELREAAHCYEQALQNYKESPVPSEEGTSEVLTRLLAIHTALGVAAYDEAGAPVRYADLARVPENIVLHDKPFLREVDSLAPHMPAQNRSDLYVQASIHWDDAGWHDRAYAYLVKALECHKQLRDNLPLTGELFPAERRAQYMERTRYLMEVIISSLMSRQGREAWSPNPLADAFAYREQFGPTGLLDELEVEHLVSTAPPIALDGNQELQSRDPLAGQTVTLAEVQRRLPRGTVLIQYVLTERLLGALVVTHDTVHAPIYHSDVHPGERSTVPLEVTHRVREFLMMIGDEHSKSGELTYSGFPHQRDLPVVQEHAKWLYETLVRPTESAWCRDGQVVADRLVIVPHGALHQLPFCTLFDGTAFLAERIPIVECPSATILMHCYDRRPTNPVAPTYFGFANPRGSDSSWAKLEDVFGCERAVAAAAGGLGSLCWDDDDQATETGRPGDPVYAVRREAATRGCWLENAPRYSLVDLETHCRFRGGDGTTREGLQHDFLVAGDDGKPCWFSARDVFLSVRMRADLLVAAMCQSGRVEIQAGDELVGLLRAFLFAGCRSILMYPWMLEDDSAAEFTRCFFAGLIREQGKKDQALRSAQLHMIDQGRQGQSCDGVPWSHPHYWAWILVGDHA